MGFWCGRLKKVKLRWDIIDEDEVCFMKRKRIVVIVGISAAGLVKKELS